MCFLLFCLSIVPYHLHFFFCLFLFFALVTLAFTLDLLFLRWTLLVRLVFSETKPDKKDFASDLLKIMRVATSSFELNDLLRPLLVLLSGMHDLMFEVTLVKSIQKAAATY